MHGRGLEVWWIMETKTVRTYTSHLLLYNWIYPFTSCFNLSNSYVRKYVKLTPPSFPYCTVSCAHVFMFIFRSIFVHYILAIQLYCVILKLWLGNDRQNISLKFSNSCTKPLPDWIALYLYLHVCVVDVICMFSGVVMDDYRGDHLKGSIINCPKCSKVFLDRSLLDHHSTVHSSNGDYTCPYKSEWLNIVWPDLRKGSYTHIYFCDFEEA